MRTAEPFFSPTGDLQNSENRTESDMIQVNFPEQYGMSSKDRSLETLRKMSKLLSKEEACGLAAVYAEQAARKYHVPAI